MGCLNHGQGFSHWFGNIHFSGPCNRACYFCIGQHMMALDALNNLDKWPLEGIDEFIVECQKHGVREINVTGSDTDPLLYKHMAKLKEYLKQHIPDLIFGLRTNGALIVSKPEVWALFDKASITIQSLDPTIYKKMMGKGSVPDLEKILYMKGPDRVKINIVLGPENTENGDVFETVMGLSRLGYKTVNLREPYGQARIGNPFEGYLQPTGYRLGMPYYNYRSVDVTYWDVHFVEVESVNLYASGRISVEYPISKGHAPTGVVLSQDNWTHGRHVEQWTNFQV